MIEKLEKVLEFLKKIPNDVHAVLLLLTGVVLVLTGHDDIGKQLAFAAVAIFKGNGA